MSTDANKELQILVRKIQKGKTTHRHPIVGRRSTMTGHSGVRRKIHCFPRNRQNRHDLKCRGQKVWSVDPPNEQCHPQKRSDRLAKIINGILDSECRAYAAASTAL